MLRLILIVVCGMVAWLGFDGARVALFNADLKSFTIEEVEANGIDGARYIEVTEAIPTGVVVYTEDQKSGAIDDIIFPVSTLENFVLTDDINPAPATLYIKRKPGMRDGEPCNEANDFCIDMDVNTHVGIVQVGLNNMDEETRDLFVENGITLSEDSILLAEGEKPESAVMNLVLMGLAIIGLLVLLWSFTWGKKEEELSAE